MGGTARPCSLDAEEDGAAAAAAAVAGGPIQGVVTGPCARQAKGHRLSESGSRRAPAAAAAGQTLGAPPRSGAASALTGHGLRGRVGRFESRSPQAVARVQHKAQSSSKPVVPSSAFFPPGSKARRGGLDPCVCVECCPVERGASGSVKHHHRRGSRADGSQADGGRAVNPARRGRTTLTALKPSATTGPQRRVSSLPTQMRGAGEGGGGRVRDQPRPKHPPASRRGPTPSERRRVQSGSRGQHGVGGKEKGERAPDKKSILFR